jgi:hypothetical protein
LSLTYYSQHYSSSPSQPYEEESEFSQSPRETLPEFDLENKRSRLLFRGGKTGLQSPPPIATTTRLTRASSPMLGIIPIHDEHEEDEVVEEQD